jgi:hypothetical protein
MAESFWSILSFIVGLIISTIIIYSTTKLFGEKEGIKRAFTAAVTGSVIYSITYFLLGRGILAALAGGFVWLLAMKGLYDISWFKAFFIALIVWIVTGLAGLLLPTAPGPL